MATILVTGRNGFVGQELTRRLKGTHKVVAIIRQMRPGIDYGGEELIICDLKKVKAEDIKKHRVDLIVHLAAQIRGRARDIERNNIQSAGALFDAAGRLKTPVILLSSTNALYESALGSYARSKRIAENFLKVKNIPYLILRVPLVIGRNSFSMRAIRSFYRKFAFFPLFGRQEGKIQPIAVASLVDVLLSKINSTISGRETLNVVGWQSYTYRQIIEKIIGGKKKALFLTIPFQLSLMVARLFEYLRLPFFISSEEIISVNMDQNVEPNRHGPTIFFDNSQEILFA